MRSTDEKLLNFSKSKYLLPLIFTASVTIILKENLKLKKILTMFLTKEEASVEIQ